MAAPSPRAPVAWLLLPLLLGYLAAPGLPAAPGLLALGGALFTLAALAAAWSRNRWVAAAWPWLGFAAAALLACGYLQHRTAPAPGWESLPAREAVLTLKVERLFGSADGRLHGFARISESEPHLTALKGRKVYFSMAPSEENERWARGTQLRTVGVLRALSPEAPEEEPFLQHLVRSGAQFQFERVTLTESPAPAGGFFGFCARQHDRLETFLRRGSTGDFSAVNVYVAMFLGKRSELTGDQKKSFLQSGTLHLFAISGLHIGVIAFSLHSFFTLLRVPHKPAAVVGLTLLFCFVGITGATPSAVRAFLMVLFFWGARFFVRAPNPIAALANSAFLVLLIFPNQLWSPGFQLSYAVVAGILFLGLPFGRHLQEKWTPFAGLPAGSMNLLQRRAAASVRTIVMTLAISLSATLLSSPLSIHYFEIFAPGGALLNLLLIPAAALVIVAGFLAVALHLLGLGAVGIVFNHAAWLVITAMEWMVNAAPAVPAFFWKASFATPWIGPVGVLTVLGSILACSYRQWRAPLCHFVVPFLVFVLFLSAAARLTFLTD